MDNLEGVFLTHLRVIDLPNGNVMQVLKQSQQGFSGFGEAYFSFVNHNVVKGWKKHIRMTLNVVVPIGEIQFVLFDAREISSTFRQTSEIALSPQSNYSRLTVPPGIWMAFKGIGENTNMLLNIASIEHDPSEAESLPIQNSVIPYTFK